MITSKVIDTLKERRILVVAVVIALALLLAFLVAPTSAARSVTGFFPGTFNVGNSAVYFPEPFTGEVTISRPSVFPGGVRHSFNPTYLEVDYTNPTVRGTMVVFFNLNERMFAQHEEGNLNIYFRGEEDAGFFRCAAQFYLPGDPDNLRDFGVMTCYLAAQDGWATIGTRNGN
ncbi:MAG: hypothetical protein DWQ07_13415 [Chloroflexi bacterium]|nr:MAG: hypothetical protein DWQ07_13415 [Chloroflexota bacterium]MBL1196765.1 hypothetical protein [Chloroflexota bacterium]NOH14059.1 hypothetical protein [Chloroflexota bacterium]